ncbi:hypothetical protein MSAN_00303800 [Mycena sanguinolenta]|uniref:Transmembrane protein n=1 Tax=Mycena sanguinolenta TaxID=230812 RepID=A0A8H7DH75_9AGAR|nr:hypothetical protein MSAN_00303800 [Mycena sanguinolenta]
MSPFLALVNVPLSAYNIVQEVTYQPNDTLPPIFLENLVPSVLQNPTSSFTPQLLSVGDTIALDNHIFNYTISQAFDSTGKPLSSFLYYNNPLSDSCDVANITVQLLLNRNEVPEVEWIPQVQVGGTVACYLPTPFYLTWSGLPVSDDVNSVRFLPSAMSLDFVYMLIATNWRGPDETNATQVDLSFTVHPCCDCERVVADSLLENGALLLHTPCSSNPPHFVVVAYPTIVFYLPGFGEYSLIADELGSYPMQITDLLANSGLGNLFSSDLSTVCENLLQTVYHLVRVDLGVILDNQICISPEMFNRTIMPIEVANFFSSAKEARKLTSDATVMAQWQQDVEFFRNNTRVPSLEYLRSVPRLKPLGSAVTSIFVSTFAMLSVMWTVFSLVAGTLARKHSAAHDTMGKKHTVEQCERGDKWLESRMQETDESEDILLDNRTDTNAVERWRQRVDRNDMRTRVALARINSALKKHGLMDEEDDWEDDMAV